MWTWHIQDLVGIPPTQAPYHKLPSAPLMYTTALPPKKRTPDTAEEEVVPTSLGDGELHTENGDDVGRR